MIPEWKHLFCFLKLSRTKCTGPRMDRFLKLSKHEILTGAGRISAAMAEEKAKEEYHKFKEIQDGELSRSDRDYIAALEISEKAVTDYKANKKS